MPKEKPSTPKSSSPTITPGKLVNYIDQAGTHLIAVIIEVLDEEQGHCALRNLATLQVAFANYSSDPKPLTWHFLEKVV